MCALTRDGDAAQEDNLGHKLFVGGLDLRLSEYAGPPCAGGGGGCGNGCCAWGSRRGTVIKMFEPFGKIARFDYLWHTSGPNRGEPRGFCFVEYQRREVGARGLCMVPLGLT
jgi:RNA recognition motif-containing protein